MGELTTSAAVPKLLIHVRQPQKRLGDALHFIGLQSFAEIFLHDVIVELIVADAVHSFGAAPFRVNAGSGENKDAVVKRIIVMPDPR
jgi:hypothetical protein